MTSDSARIDRLENMVRVLMSRLASGAGTGDMQKSTYDPDNVATQVVGRTSTQTLTNKSISASQITSGTFATGDFVFNGDLEVNDCIS